MVSIPSTILGVQTGIVALAAVGWYFLIHKKGKN